MHKTRTSPRKVKVPANKTTPPDTPPPNSLDSEEMSAKYRAMLVKKSLKRKMDKEDQDGLEENDYYQDDEFDDDTKISETNSSVLSNSSFDVLQDEAVCNQPVGQQLLEQLDKGKRKQSIGKKVNKRTPPTLKVCGNCKTTAQTIRAKKCYRCGHFLSMKMAKLYSTKPCPHCNLVPKVGRGGRPANCPFCHKPLLDEQYLMDTKDMVYPQNDPPFISDGNAATPTNQSEDMEMVKQDTFHMTANVGYGTPTTVEEGEDNNGIANAEIKKLLKSHIGGSEDISKFVDGLNQSTPQSPPNTLSVSLPSTFASEKVSSPLLQYAQKISARVMLPPEISPHLNAKKLANKQGKRMTKLSLGKSNKGNRNKTTQQQQPEMTPAKSDPVANTSPTPSPGAVAENEPIPPLHSDKTVLQESPTPTKSSTPSLPAIISVRGGVSSDPGGLTSPVLPPPPLPSSKPHDPTINSIRSLSHENFSPRSLTPPISSIPPPPLIQPGGGVSYHAHHVIDLYHPSLSPIDDSSASRTKPIMKYSYNNSSRSLPVDDQPQPLRDRSLPPPLVPVTTPQEDWEQEGNRRGLYCHEVPPVTHHKVIVEPTKSKPDHVPITSTVSMATPSFVSMATETAPKGTVHEEQSVVGYVQEMEEQPPPVSIAEEKPHKSHHHHSKRKQKVMLSDRGLSQDTDDDFNGGEIKKKKKKKKKKEKDREKGERSHKHRDQSDKHSEKKMKKKKAKKKEREMEMATSQTDEEEPQLLAEENPPEKKNLTEINHEVDSNTFSVKIADLTIHKLKWDQYTMTLLIPRSNNITTPIKETTPTESLSQSTCEQEVPSEDSFGETRLLRSGRKRLREQITYEGGEEGDGEDDSKIKKRKKGKGQGSITPSLEEEDIKTNEREDESEEVMAKTLDVLPSFSVFELRNKLFSGYPPRTVHAFTYKLKLKTRRPPLHWIHVLKRVGGLPESCHTCRLLDVEAVKQLCDFHKISIPPSLDLLLNNQLEGNREVIDLSEYPSITLISQPEILHYNIPQCSFNDSIPRKKSSRQKIVRHKFLSHEETSVKEETQLVDSTTASQEDGDDMSQTLEEEEEGDGDGEGEEEEKETETKRKKDNRKYKQRPSSLEMEQLKSQGNTGSGGGRKKPCSHCGLMVLCKSKKCRNCGKLFGVFTFGRRLCINCGHINLARMSACFKCSAPLDKAPTAKPKDIDTSYANKDPSSSTVAYQESKIDFKFGVRKRRKIHAGGGGHFGVNGAPPSRPKPAASEPIDERDTEDEEEPGSNEPLDQPMAEERRKSKKDQHLGYQYGKIPWNDADLALLITSVGTPKFCLQEVCNKVLRYHNKVDVFEMVKNLHLSLEQGNSNLLKRLQALGLHPNRSPICKLISAEDLFALMDAMEEAVPEEVHQHLESVSLNTSPLSPSSPQPSIMPYTPVAPPPPPASSSTSLPFNHVSLVTGHVDEEADNEFESTLHEVKCSDGQSLSMLRSWDGTHFLCLLEVWRRYFPEVNRSHLSAVIKKMFIETQIPTSQQTNLLRAANVISMRGAPGRLIRMQDVQRLLDDFSIPLQIGADLDKTPEKMIIPVCKPSILRYQSKFLPNKYHMTSAFLGGAENATRNGLAKCMDLLLDVLEPDELINMLEVKEDCYQREINILDEELNSLDFKLNLLKNSLMGGRDLCQTLCDEVGFMTVTNHTLMAEYVRIDRNLIQCLHDVDGPLDSSKLLSLLGLASN